MVPVVVSPNDEWAVQAKFYNRHVEPGLCMLVPMNPISVPRRVALERDDDFMKQRAAEMVQLLPDVPFAMCAICGEKKSVVLLRRCEVDIDVDHDNRMLTIGGLYALCDCPGCHMWVGTIIDVLTAAASRGRQESGLTVGNFPNINNVNGGSDDDGSVASSNGVSVDSNIANMGDNPILPRLYEVVRRVVPLYETHINSSSRTFEFEDVGLPPELISVLEEVLTRGYYTYQDQWDIAAFRNAVPEESEVRALVVLPKTVSHPSAIPPPSPGALTLSCSVSKDGARSLRQYRGIPGLLGHRHPLSR